MGIEDIELDRGKFSEVWSRVTQNAEKPDEETKLRGFIDAEAEAIQQITSAAERCCRHIAASLYSVAECDTQHFKELRARFFILTGKRRSPPELCPVPGAPHDTLRGVYIAKQQLIEDYRALSASDVLYARLAEEEERSAREIYRVIMILINR